MLDSAISTETSRGPGPTLQDPPRSVTVFPSRARFEAGIGEIIRSAGTECAVLCIMLDCAGPCDESARRRVLKLAGSTLRAGMQAGAVAYLGAGQFALLLQDTDVLSTTRYARAMSDIISCFRVSGGERTLSLRAYTGGIMAGDCGDGRALLAAAEAACFVACGRPEQRVHMADPAPAPAEQRTH